MVSTDDDREGAVAPAFLGGDRRWSGGTPPRDVTGWSITALFVAVIIVFATWSTLRDIYAALSSIEAEGVVAAAVLALCATLA